MKTLSELIDVIRGDCLRRNAGKCNFFAFIRLYFSYPEFQYLTLYRICSIGRHIPLLNILVLPLVRLRKFYLSRKLHMHISEKMNIGRGLRIDHFGGIILTRETVVGNNCNISCGVVFGYIPRGINTGVPERIGNNVYIGPGAKLLGRITVGDNAVIGANSVVTKSVPPGASVMGIPARVVGYDGSERYVDHPI
jgi:serine O-acetyltransferase